VASPLAAAAAVAEALRNFLRLELVGIRFSPVYGLFFAPAAGQHFLVPSQDGSP
jgi:hypothetical protein